jgi:hypothetical protein
MPDMHTCDPKAVCTPASALAGTETGRAQWFTEKVHVHGPSLRNYLRGVFPTVRDVDDVVQESFLLARARRPADFVREGLSISRGPPPRRRLDPPRKRFPDQCRNRFGGLIRLR